MRFFNLASLALLTHLIHAAPAPVVEYVTKTHIVYVRPDGAIVGTSSADSGAVATAVADSNNKIVAETVAELVSETSPAQAVPTNAVTPAATTTTSAANTYTPATATTTSSSSTTSQPQATQTSSADSGEFEGDGTYFDPAVGACGTTSSSSDYIVAISDELYSSSMQDANPNNNPVCGKKIRAFYEGKSVEVTVVDRCMGCQKYDLDLSPAAFESIADKALGRIKLSWNWV